MNVKRKRNVRLKLHNEVDFDHTFDLTEEVFFKWSIECDFAVLKLPKEGFTMARIPISADVPRTLRIHACGYIGHLNSFNVTQGIVSGFIPRGFTMNFLSAEGFSGSAVVSDFYGHAVGYVGGNYDASESKNSQHQAFAFRFDEVILATSRRASPASSPAAKGVI